MTEQAPRLIVIDTSAALTCSPVAARASISRMSGTLEIS
jgi:hypothetical protein